MMTAHGAAALEVHVAGSPEFHDWCPWMGLCPWMSCGSPDTAPVVNARFGDRGSSGGGFAS